MPEYQFTFECMDAKARLAGQGTRPKGSEGAGDDWCLVQGPIGG